MQVLHDDVDNRANGWTLLAAFADRFLRGFTSHDSVSRDEMTRCEALVGQRLPESLVEFYRLCGHADDLWSRQDEWLKPTELRRTGDVLVFWRENQGNWRIGIRESDLTLEDPPVVWDAASWMYGVGGHGEFTVLAETVSKFALNMIAYVAKFFGDGERPFGNTWEVARLLDTLQRYYSRCQLQKEWVYGREAYFQDADTFIELSEVDGFVYPVFKTSEAVARFCSLLDGFRFQWEVAPAANHR